ncbi:MULTISPECIES: tRNA pseudouridine(13) synthase TruD [unclassified Moraxella]|uniref:tRNA pseudouridine(13) synthase TruD n=1 Tax=unclassified Moraxella TaxID=2685852 RepID=UPI00359DD731
MSIHSPSITATLKQTPADFIVTEQLTLDFDGVGEHLWVYVEKINLNTTFVARLLSNWANIPSRDVGYSGLKDRHAKTYQWFSLRLPTKTLPDGNFDDFIKDKLHANEAVHIIKSAWHGRKLNRGTHKNNHFCITLKNIKGDQFAINARLEHLLQHGVPNYFGEQRFGNGGENITKAIAFFEQLLNSDKPYKPHKKDLERHSLLISSARSHLFNEVLATRVADDSWDKPLTGEVFNLDGTGSIFTADIDDTIIKRLQIHDIHPTIALYGVGDNKASQDALATENHIFHDDKYRTLVQGLEKVGIKMARRATRLLVHELVWQWQDDTTLVVEFTLPKGTFATVVLSAFIDVLSEPNRPSILSEQS